MVEGVKVKMGDVIEMKKAKAPKAIRFAIGNPSVEYLRIEEGGDFYVMNRLVTNDKEIYDGFTTWFGKAQEHTARLQAELELLDNKEAP